MRLVNVQKFLKGNKDFFELFEDKARPPYAIVSHTWGHQEVLFQHMRSARRKPEIQNLEGYLKIVNACKQASQDCYKYLWIDTICIDRTSSAELQEALNSMYQWYQDSEICYAHLSDLSSNCPQLRDERRDTGWFEAFKSCRWFYRGWTLQELLAPKKLIFYSTDWTWVAALRGVPDMVSEITHIPTGVLLHERPLQAFSIATRMSWASQRQTKKVEDVAYSLLGIFDVNMTMQYGERDKAFTRLQEELIKSSTDQSIFLWPKQRTESLPSSHIETFRGALLASSPADFADSDEMLPVGNITYHRINSIHQWANGRLRLDTELVNLREKDCYAAVLNCHEQGKPERFVALRLKKNRSLQRDGEDTYHVHCRLIREREEPHRPGPVNAFYSRLTYLSRGARARAEKKTITIVQRPRFLRSQL